MPTDFDQIFTALNDAGVRYLVVGGVAVVIHGHPRMTADLDLVVEFTPENTLRATHALESIGYQPRLPVKFSQFADEKTREAWIVEKGMMVFSLWNPKIPATEIDLFAREPFDFIEAFARALHVEIGEIKVSVASIADLIILKEKAGRTKDLEDIEALKSIRGIMERDGK